MHKSARGKYLFLKFGRSTGPKVHKSEGPQLRRSISPKVKETIRVWVRVRIMAGQGLG